MNVEELTVEVAKYRHGKVPRALRRQQLLARAHDLFVELGYAGASMDELARRVGVSKPVIYDLVGSKEQLFRDVMAAIDEELETCVATAVAAAPDDSLRLHAGILAFLRFVRDRRAAWAALLSSNAGPTGAALATLRRRQAKLVANLVIGGVGDDQGVPNARTAEALAHAIQGAVEFVALWWQAHPDISSEALADLLTRAFSPALFELSTLELTGPADL